MYINKVATKDNNLTWHSCVITKKERAHMKKQNPCIIWLTGLSGSGKSAIANEVENLLSLKGYHTHLLDGDNIRHGLNNDLSFSDEDRSENIRRIGEVSKLFVDAGLIVLASFISPFRKERQAVRDLVGSKEFLEVHINTPICVCEQRDPKGLYKKARKGEIKFFTGIDSPYEDPINPEITIDSSKCTIKQSAEIIFQHLIDNGTLKSHRSKERELLG
jgi:adenylylsulfate kinase